MDAESKCLVKFRVISIPTVYRSTTALFGQHERALVFLTNVALYLRLKTSYSKIHHQHEKENTHDSFINIKLRSGDVLI